MKRTAIYIRVSTDKQAQEGDSVPAQRAALHKYIDDRPDLVCSGEYLDDGISGQKYAQRDELQRLLDDVRAKNIDLIIFTKLDRWFRSVRHYTATQEILDKYGVGWLAIWEPIYDTTTPAGRLIVNQMMSIAQFEAENTGQRIRQVQAYKVMQGEVISGSCPPGYSIVDKHLVPNEHADDVREAFRLYDLTGNLNDTMRQLSHLGSLPRSKPAFKNMLQNTKYIGVFRGNDHFCPAIIDRALFDRVQRKLSMNVRSSQKQVYIFSGLLKCAECGRSLGANTRRRTRGNSYSEVHQYRCVKHFASIPQCSNSKLVTETALEKYLVANIREMAETKINASAQPVKIKDNSKRISALTKRLDRLKDLYLNEAITLDEYKQDREKIAAELHALESEQPAAAPDLSALHAFIGSSVLSVYETMTPEEKRYFWRSVIKVIRFGADRSIDIEFL